MFEKGNGPEGSPEGQRVLQVGCAAVLLLGLQLENKPKKHEIDALEDVEDETSSKCQENEDCGTEAIALRTLVLLNYASGTSGNT